MNECYLSNRNSRNNLQNFFTVLTLMNREDELRRLVKWAGRNGHAHPLRLYKNRLTDTEKTLFRARFDAPLAIRNAHAAFILKKVLFPQPKYYQKGSASAYKRASLTA
jgi:hypothetical protein